MKKEWKGIQNRPRQDERVMELTRSLRDGSRRPATPAGPRPRARLARQLLGWGLGWPSKRSAASLPLTYPGQLAGAACFIQNEDFA